MPKFWKVEILDLYFNIVSEHYPEKNPTATTWALAQPGYIRFSEVEHKPEGGK